MTTPPLLDVPNACTPQDGICTGGRPRPEHLRQAKERGVRRVVNLCPPNEACDYDEAAVVAALGLDYVNIPVAGPADLTPENARKLAEAIRDASAAHPVFVHCASGNRVGGLFAIKARYVDGLDAERALAVGRSAGLTKLEPEVRKLL
ncbi:MAG: sulfur transferase domain-containing protein [Sinobacteraceae bacterium]|nr:sulfur transferase domain-containing protein [Nevskiaceae bacterium]